MPPRHWLLFSALGLLLGLGFACTVEHYGLRIDTEERTHVVGARKVVPVGETADFPPGSVTQIMLPAILYDPSMFRPSSTGPSVVGYVSPVPIFFVHHPEEGFIALYNRDPASGCRLSWQESQQKFIDPCYGADYTDAGGYLEPPAPHSLDRFRVLLAEGGELLVDLRAFEPGPSPSP